MIMLLPQFLGPQMVNILLLALMECLSYVINQVGPIHLRKLIQEVLWIFLGLLMELLLQELVVMDKLYWVRLLIDNYLMENGK